MRSSLSPKAIAGYSALVALAALAACSDTTAPTTSLRSAGAASHDLGTTTNVGPVQQTIVSNNTTTQYCGSSIPSMNPFPTTITPFADGTCVAATDLMTALTTSYNPGWAAPLTGSDWISMSSTANQYTVQPGTYKFNTTFNLPAGATAPVLNVTTLSDNLVAVYLNNTLLGAQTVQDCVTAPCNWQNTFTTSSSAAFVTGTNTLTFYLVDTPIGLGKSGSVAPLYRCAIEGPQEFGQLGFGTDFNVPTPQYAAYHTAHTWDPAVCLNPAGLDFVATLSYNPQVTGTTWCSPGFWKNHEDLWTAYWTKRYGTLSGAAPLGKKAPAGYDPTLKEVVENPQIYGGEATNSVADFLSNKAFGTPIGSGVESCPNPGSITVPPPVRS